MQPLLPPPDVQDALREFLGWGAVVEQALFAAPPIVDFPAHETAAKLGLELVVEETRRQTPLWKIPPTRWPENAIERAVPVSSRDFLGDCFDWEGRKPLLPFWGVSGLRPYDYEVDERLRGTHMSYSVDNGYAYAVLLPPYGLYGAKSQHRTNLEIGAAFLNLCDALFGDLDTLQIYEWPTDVSDYFKPGYEWWGSFFWTVYAPTQNWIVTIIASTTD